MIGRRTERISSASVTGVAPCFQNIVEEIDMFRRVDAVLAAGKHCDRAGSETGAMCGGIDAALRDLHPCGGSVT